MTTPQFPRPQTTFLTGPTGTGKTSRAVAHLQALLAQRVPANNILVLVPQQTLAQPYTDLLNRPDLPASSQVTVTTLSGLSLQTTKLFWPLVTDRAGFGQPHRPPIFLNIEASQYYLREAIEPLFVKGYFAPNVVDVTIALPRLMSQILDNLNKAALMGLPHHEVSQRLAASLRLEPKGRVALEHTQTCVNRFREFCLARNLLDYSLRIDTFYQHLWPVPGIQQFLVGRYRHLIIDNIEEDNTFSHTVLKEWLPQAESALVINDEAAGYRIFLGANWRTARELETLCQQTERFDQSHVASPSMLTFADQIGQVLLTSAQEEATAHGELASQDAGSARLDLFPAEAELTDLAPEDRTPLHSAFQIQHSEFAPYSFHPTRFYPQMIDRVVEQVDMLITAGTPAEQIVVLAPFVSDALRFAFIHRMEKQGIAARSHRPSRPLSDEPAAKTVLTLACLAFPEWRLLPEPLDVALAFSQAIEGLDPVRANLLTQIVYRQYERSGTDGSTLTRFEQIEGTMRERISYQVGMKFDHLRQWLIDTRTSDGGQIVLDHFFSKLFGEVLSQPGFGFHDDRTAGEVIANLIDSVRVFRRVAAEVPIEDGNLPQVVDFRETKPAKLPTMIEINKAYLRMVEQGVFAAQYVRSWEQRAQDAVLIAPATTFLMSNRPVDYQFWLDAGSSGWWERIAQPLTHPYILAADWETGRPWTDLDEVSTQNDRLYRLVLGLARRCRRELIIHHAEIGEQGYEQRGQLLVALQRLVRRSLREQGGE